MSVVLNYGVSARHIYRTKRSPAIHPELESFEKQDLIQRIQNTCTLIEKTTQKTAENRRKKNAEALFEPARFVSYLCVMNYLYIISNRQLR